MSLKRSSEPCLAKPSRLAVSGDIKFHTYRDDLVRVYVDVPDLAEHKSFFIEFKERMKIKFDQIDLWMTTYLIEVI